MPKRSDWKSGDTFLSGIKKTAIRGLFVLLSGVFIQGGVSNL